MIYIMLVYSLIMLWLDYRATRVLLSDDRTRQRRRLLFMLWFFDALPFIYWLLTNRFVWRDNPTWMDMGGLWINFIYMLTVVARGPLMLSLVFLRNRWWHILTALLGVGAIYMFMYGIIVTRTDYDVRHVILRSERLPKAFDGYRIVQISDVQFGSLLNPAREMEQIVTICNNQRADLVAFTGDLINVRHNEITPDIEAQMRRLRAKDGVVAITGNHDRGVYIRDTLHITTAWTTAATIASMRQTGWNVLDDSSMHIRRGNDSISVTGISFSHILQKKRHLSSLPDFGFSHVYDGVDRNTFNITLSHIPQLWDSILDEGYADLTLAGHVHAMEMKLPIGRRGISPAQILYKRWSGLYEKGDRWLYINDGIASALFLMRLGARPEITVIELYCK